TTGLAAEVYADGIAVTVLSPSGLVPTPGGVHHNLDNMIPEAHHEPPAYMAEPSYALCTGDPATLTGRIAFSQSLLEELGIDVPAWPGHRRRSVAHRPHPGVSRPPARGGPR